MSGAVRALLIAACLIPALQSGSLPSSASRAGRPLGPRPIGSSSDASPGRPEPPRVDVNSPLSVRTQIKLARYFKELQRADQQKGGGHGSSPRFRRAKGARGPACVEEECTPGSDAPTVLLVDGYNVIGQWPLLAKLRDEGNLARARDRLVEHMADYAVYMDWKAEIVFDAAGREERVGLSDSVEPAGRNVDIVYSGEAADTYIGVQAKRLLREQLASSVFVATADWAVQQTVEACDGHVISARQMVNQITGLQKAIRKQVASSNLEASAHFGAFTDHLSPKSRGALLEIERKLAASKPEKPRKADFRASKLPGPGRP